MVTIELKPGETVVIRFQDSKSSIEVSLTKDHRIVVETTKPLDFAGESSTKIQ